MANRRDYYYRELVTEAELDAGFEGLEEADRAMIADLGIVGTYFGLTVTQHAGVANLTVDVTSGASYDQTGERCYVPASQTVNVAVDSTNTSTTVSGVGNERYVSVFLVFARALSDPRTDGNSLTVMFERDESFAFTVVQGAEAAVGTAVRPGLLGSGILLADVHLIHGQTAVLNADVDTSRRQWPFSVTGSPRSITRGRVTDAISDVMSYYNAHVSGTADKHNASAILYSGGPTWEDGTTNPATDVGSQLTSIISNLVAAGDFRIGVTSDATQSPTLAAGTLRSRLTALRVAANIAYAGGGNWADGSTNPATSVEAQLDKIVADLTNTGTGQSGADKVYCSARVAWLGGRSNATPDTVRNCINKIIADLNATTVSDDGAQRIGFNNVGTSISSTDVHDAIVSVDSRAMLGTAKPALYTNTSPGGTIASLSGIVSGWNNVSGMTITVNNLVSGQYVNLIAHFGIGGTPVGAYNVRLAYNNGAGATEVGGTNVPVDTSHSFSIGALWLVPSSGNYTFTVQYENPSTSGATMTILGSAVLAASPVYS